MDNLIPYKMSGKFEFPQKSVYIFRFCPNYSNRPFLNISNNRSSKLTGKSLSKDLTIRFSPGSEKLYVAGHSP